MNPAILRSCILPGGRVVRYLALLFLVLPLTLWATPQVVVNVPFQSGRVLKLPKSFKTLYLPTPDVATYTLRSPGVLYIQGKKLGQAPLHVLDKQGHILKTFQLKVIYPVARLQKLAKKVLGARSPSLRIEQLGDQLVIRGEVPTSNKHQKLVNAMKTLLGSHAQMIDLLHVSSQAKQINLRVKLIEVSRELNRATGLDLSTVFSSKGLGFSVDTTNLVSNVASVETISAVSQSSLSNATNQVNFGSYESGNFSISSILRILNQEKLATILAEPSITTVSGHTASIKVGGEVPITSVNSGLIQSTQVVYKPYGIELLFTPTVLDDGRIRVKVAPKMSRPESVQANPRFLRRSVSTTVELVNGQSFAIAGLLENHMSQHQQQVPGVKQVPVLSSLLTQAHGNQIEREFVIIIIPYLVKPTHQGMSVDMHHAHPSNKMVGPGFITN